MFCTYILLKSIKIATLGSKNDQLRNTAVNGFILLEEKGILGTKYDPNELKKETDRLLKEPLLVSIDMGEVEPRSRCKERRKKEREEEKKEEKREGGDQSMEKHTLWGLIAKQKERKNRFFFLSASSLLHSTSTWCENFVIPPTSTMYITCDCFLF